MRIQESISRHKVAVTLGGILLGPVAYKRMDPYLNPVINGKVVREAVIPKGLPEKDRQTHPYWVDIRYIHPDHKDYSTIRLIFGTPYTGYFTQLEKEININDNLTVRVDERSGDERSVKEVLEIERHHIRRIKR